MWPTRKVISSTCSGCPKSKRHPRRENLILGFGAPELLIILAHVIVVFGAGHLGQIASELGSGIRNFREALQDKEEKNE